MANLIHAAVRTGTRVRPLGAGHSFTSIGSPESSWALDLSSWSGIVNADPTTGLVEVRAGTPLHRLNTELDELGLAMANLGDIDRQTIAGAISTGTHGTGARHGGLATQVEALNLLLADGTEHRCTAKLNPELFAAARVGLGALGVITTVTLRCVSAFSLASQSIPMRLEEVRDRFDALAADHDHISVYWFPHSAHTLVTLNNRTADIAGLTPLSRARRFIEHELLENQLYGAICALGRTIPPWVRTLNRVCARAWATRSYTDRSYRVLTAPRRVRFVESEFAIPRENLGEVLTELRWIAGQLDDPVMFPVEVRIAEADDIWLSPAYQRQTAYVAVHQAIGMPYREWFDAFHRIATAVGGRPHWGKLHHLEAAALRERYPRFDDFRRVRAHLDPGGTFSNDYLDRVLGNIDT